MSGEKTSIIKLSATEYELLDRAERAERRLANLYRLGKAWIKAGINNSGAEPSLSILRQAEENLVKAIRSGDEQP